MPDSPADPTHPIRFMNLFEQQASNRRRTWLVMALFVAFLFLLGYGFDRFYLGVRGPVSLGGLVSLAVGGVSAFSGYYAGDRAVLLSTGAAPIASVQAVATSDARRLKLRQLENVVDEMALAAGLPRPRLFVIPDPDPNAFATGRDPAHASIAVTDGLLEMLPRDELQGVVAHELSHVRNLDIRLMTVIAALVGAVVLLADWTGRGLRFGGASRGSRRNRDRGHAGPALLPLFVVWIIAIVLAPTIGQLLAMMVSRRREYLADASGAELTRNPLALASALERIEGAAAPTAAVKRGTAHLCIADPLGRALGSREGFLPDLFASHPPMGHRIAALREMGYQEPEQSKR